MSKINTLLELVEAGQFSLAEDMVDDARSELHSIMEFDEKSYDKLGELIPKLIGDWQHKNPSSPGNVVTGGILIMECKMVDSSGLTMVAWGNMEMPHSRIGALQCITSSQMDQELG